MSDLPEDTLYYNILTWIPIKSLVRFRCVCQQWRDLANIHHAIEEPKPIHIGPIKSYVPFQQPTSILGFLRVTEDNVDGIQVEKDLSSIFQVKRSLIIGQEYHKLQGYCYGLISLVKHNHLYNIGTTFVVINPLTKECHQLPRLKRPKHENIIGKGLGFDHSTNTFKMVCLLKKEKASTQVNGIHTLLHVLGTDSWQEVPQVLFYDIHGEAVYANGRLYWFVSGNYVVQSHLVWFDMKTEEFGVTDLPKQTEGLYRLNLLVDLNGELGFVYYDLCPDDDVEVWILKHEEWKIHCVFDESKYSNCYGPLAILGCWNKDGDILMKSSQGQLVVYRLKSGGFYSLIGPEGEAEGEETAEIRMYQSSLLSIRKWH